MAVIERAAPLGSRTNLKTTLTGILPPVAVPFDDKGEVVYSAIAEQIDLMVDRKVRGVVVGGSTGEGHTLDRDEFVQIIRESAKAVRGRVPMVAGLIVNSTQEAIRRVKMLEGVELAALQITPVHYLFKPDAEATIAHFREIYDATGIPVLIYNVIPWNYLSVELMLRIMREVPGVVGMKQSSGDLKSVSDLLLSVQPDNLVLSGIDALLYPAFMLGADGAISALTTAIPGVCVQLWDAAKAGDHKTALDLHRKLGTLWNAMTHDNLPACVKYVQHRQGLGFYQPRAPMNRVSQAQKAAIDKALSGLPI